MLISLNPLVDGFSGKVQGVLPSGLVTYRTSASQRARTWVNPANPDTSFQQAVRSAMAAASAAWKALPAAGAESWNTFAAQYSSTDPFGGTAPLSGINVFCQVNSYRQLDGQSISSTLPTDPTPPTLGQVTVDNVTLTGADVDVDVSVDNTNATKVLLRLSNPTNGLARLYRANDCAVKGSFAACFAAVAADAVHYDLVTSDFSPTLTTNDNLGILLTPLTSEYLPGPKHLVTQFLTD